MSFTELAGKVWGSNLPCEYLLTDEVDWRHHYPDNIIFSDVFWFKKLLRWFKRSRDLLFPFTNDYHWSKFSFIPCLKGFFNKLSPTHFDIHFSGRIKFSSLSHFWITNVSWTITGERKLLWTKPMVE